MISRHEMYGHPQPVAHCPQCVNVYAQRALNEKHRRHQMKPEWIKIASWHIVASQTRVEGHYATLCNRVAAGLPQPGFLSDEKTCETCLRKQAKLDAAT